jgi:septal ring factor EnvC (AmiA/AmiB activator)
MDLAGYVVTALGGGGIVRLLDMLIKRSQIRAYTMGAVDKAVETALSSVTHQLTRTDERLKAVEEQHHDCERNLEEVRTQLHDSRAKIEKLMNGAVPVYNLSGGGDA